MAAAVRPLFPREKAALTRVAPPILRIPGQKLLLPLLPGQLRIASVILLLLPLHIKRQAGNRLPCSAPPAIDRGDG
ncbi:hypothetical protein D3C86_2117620 [compost metagenome]